MHTVAFIQQSPCEGHLKAPLVIGSLRAFSNLAARVDAEIYRRSVAVLRHQKSVLRNQKSRPAYG